MLGCDLAMNKMALVPFVISVLVAELLSTTIAQTVCEPPEQWEAELDIQNVMMRTTEYFHLIYDATNQRERIVGSVGVAAEHFGQDTLILWKERKQYVYNNMTKQCDITNVTWPFRPRGVPQGAEFEYTTSTGAAGLLGEYINTKTYYGNSTDGTYQWVVTYPSCIPVQYTHYTNDQGIETDNYYNVRLGVSTKSAWDPPKQCIK